MRDSIIFNADEIAQIMADAEEIQTSGESQYTKSQAKITAYNQIMELIRGE